MLTLHHLSPVAWLPLPTASWKPLYKASLFSSFRSRRRPTPCPLSPYQPGNPFPRKIFFSAADARQEQVPTAVEAEVVDDDEGGRAEGLDGEEEVEEEEGESGEFSYPDGFRRRGEETDYDRDPELAEILGSYFDDPQKAQARVRVHLHESILSSPPLKMLEQSWVPSPRRTYLPRCRLSSFLLDEILLSPCPGLNYGWNSCLLWCSHCLKVEERIRKKRNKVLQAKTGSAKPMIVTFNKFDFSNSYIWLEFYNAPLANDVSLICNIVRSWHIIGRLGGCNSMNMQLSQLPLDHKRPTYDAIQGANVTPTTFYNIGDLEIQDNLARIWVDIGTTEPLLLDVLINALTHISSDYVGIKQVAFGGSEFENWKENFTSEDAGCSVHKI